MFDFRKIELSSLHNRTPKKFCKDHLMGIRRSTRRNFFLLHLREAVFLCTVFSLEQGGLAAQTAAQGVLAQDKQQAAPQGKGPEQQMGGVNTGGAHAAVLDSEHRPITAGGFVKTGPVIFQDIAQKAGLTTWKHTMGTPDKHYIIETNGSGVGLIDYDNDGWLDIYFVNGSTADALSGKTAAPKAALFHNNHDGTFTDVAAKAGVTNDRWGVGV